ncbi:MAG TPA: hypothetical protein VF193_03540 [Steroidobacter sp.]
MHSPNLLESRIALTHELQRRSPGRISQQIDEKEAMLRLLHIASEAMDRLLPSLVRVVMELCEADSAALCTLDRRRTPAKLTWRILAGRFAEHSAEQQPAAPRELTLEDLEWDAERPVLMLRPERVCTALPSTGVPNYECLVVPLWRGVEEGESEVLWLVSHREHHQFDRGDERVATELGEFVDLLRRMHLSARASQERKERFAAVEPEDDRASEALAPAREIDVENARAAGIAHDLKNLLQVMSATLNLLKHARSQEERERIEVAAREAIARGREITDRLLGS